MASDVSVKMETIPLSLLVTLSSIALLGVIYAIAFIVFNIVNRNKKIIKMTSPKMNVLILCGAVFGYCTIVLLGLEISLTISTILHQACAFVIPISFTMIYGSVLVKVCRVHMIFTNLRVNGKTTRDEHLMLVVVIMITVDLLVLLLWFFLDPIQCRAQHWKQTDSAANNLTFTAGDDVTYYTELCSSSLQPAWICSLYAYKLLVLTALLYFTWRVRHVTIPSLKDSKRVLGVVYTVAVLGVIVLPILLATTWGSAGPTVRYAVGGLCIWIALTVTITLLFLPNAVLLWRQEKLIKSGDASATDAAMAGQRQFSESMTRIKRDSACCWSTSSLAACCFTEPSKQSEGDRYAQELLATELETMKLTIKEKDTTIRDLTDRLYFGAEHFQRYLTSQQLLHDEKVLETSLRYSRVATPYTIPTPSRNEIRNLRLSCFFSDPEPVASGMKHIRFRDDAAEAVRYSNEAAAAVGALVPPRRSEARYDYGYDRDSVGRCREALSECSCDGNSCSCSSCCSTWDRESREDRNVENQDSSNNNRDNHHGGRLLNSVIGRGNRTMEVNNNNNNNDAERLEELSALNLSVVGSFEESDRSQTRLVAEVHPRKQVKYQDKMSREERIGCNRTPSVVYIKRYSEHQLLQQHPSMQTQPNRNPNIQWNYNRQEYRNVHSDQHQIGQPRQNLHRSPEQNPYVQQHPNKLTEQGQNYNIQHSPHRYVQQHMLQREFIQEQLAQQSLERVNRNTNLEHHAQRNTSEAQVNPNFYVKQNANQNTKQCENLLVQHTVNHQVDEYVHQNINQPVEPFVHNPQEQPFYDQCQARMDRQFSPKRLSEESSKYYINNAMKQDRNGNSHLEFPPEISIGNSDVQKPDATKDTILMNSTSRGGDSSFTNKHVTRNVEAMNLQGSHRYTTFKPWRPNGINNRRVRCISAREAATVKSDDSNTENKIEWKNTERWRNGDYVSGTRTHPSTEVLEENGGVIDLQAIENDSFSVVNGSLPVGLTPATLGNSALSNESLKPQRSRMTSSHLPASSGERTLPPTRRNQSASPRFYEMTVAQI